MAGVQISGLLANSAFDWKSVVDQLVAVSGMPIKKLTAEQEKNTAQSEALGELGVKFQELQDAVQSIRADEVFSARTVASDVSSTTWKSSSVIGTAIGSYTFDVTQLATQSQLVGTANIGKGLTGIAITAGTFSVNGSTITVGSTDSLQDVLNRIAAVPGVTASYDAATDRVSLDGITSLADGTSNFLTELKLSGTGTVVSSTDLGVADVTIGNLPTAATIRAGEFTVDGAKVTIAATDSLKTVFDAIAAATSGLVTASYDPLADKITLKKGSGELVLGASNDTSNFLVAMKLANSGSTTVTSSASLGSVKTLAALNSAGLHSTITDGSFTINGVTISYLATESLSNIISRINESSAGVTASYDAAKDRVMLTNKGTGDLGISVSETSGGLFSALGITGATLVRGNNAEFTLNGGIDVLTSNSNTLDETVHGIAGLSVTVNTATKQTLQVESDTIRMQGAIAAFIEKFNSVQDFIEENTKVTLTGTSVSVAVLSGNQQTQEWSKQLRSLAFDAVSGLTGDISRLDHIGIDFDGTSSRLKVKDSGKLATALGDKPDDVKALFLNSSTGLVPRLYDYLVNAGSAERKQQSNLGAQNADLDEQIATLQSRLDAEREQLTNAFIRMLDAQSAAQSQSTYLTNTFFKNNSS